MAFIKYTPLSSLQRLYAYRAMALHNLTPMQQAEVIRKVELCANDPSVIDVLQAVRVFCEDVKNPREFDAGHVEVLDKHLPYTARYYTMPIGKILFRTYQMMYYIAPRGQADGYDFYVMDDYGNCAATRVSVVRQFTTAGRVHD